MGLQLKRGVLLEYQRIQVTLLCVRGVPEENIYLTLKFILSGVPVVYGGFNVDSGVFFRFSGSKY